MILVQVSNFIKYTERVQIGAWEISAVLKKGGTFCFDQNKINYWIFTREKETRNSAGILFQEQGEDLEELSSKTLRYVIPKAQEEKVLVSIPALATSMFSLQKHWLPKYLNWGRMPNFAWQGKLKGLKGKLTDYMVILVKKSWLQPVFAKCAARNIKGKNENVSSPPPVGM